MKMYEEKEFPYFDEVRSEIVAWLPDKVEKVFEVGCGSGATLSHIKTIGRATWVGGIELVGDAVLAGKSNLDLLLWGSVEDTEIPLEEGTLDVILYLDVLEHLVDPWATVEKMTKYLKPNGVIIASLPNVRNLKVVIPLIFNNEWKYVDCGQLDRTHLRFFTKKTAVELFQNAGLYIDSVPTYFSKKGKAGLLNMLTFGLFSTFLQGNIFVVARKLPK